ncbi:MAG: hypothetical protein U1D30_02405 [Planctomycetota bacterium]
MEHSVDIGIRVLSMRMHWFSTVSLATCVSFGGCSWVNNRSDFERDPFVMSHLTHHKDDPLYAGSESENAFEDEARLQSASVSRKLPARGNSAAAINACPTKRFGNPDSRRGLSMD